MFNQDGVISVNFTLEVLQGCGFSCSDCAVDKSYIKSDVSETDTADLLALLDDMKANDIRLFEFTIGPTDIVSSANGLALLEDPLVKGFAERYESLTVSLALLVSDGLDLLGKAVDKLMSGKRFRLVLPATLKNLKNKKYTDLLRTHVGILKDNLPNTSFYQIYLNTNMVKENVVDIDLETITKTANLNLGARTTLEHGFGHARAGFDNLFNRDKFLYDINAYVTMSKTLKDSQFQRMLVPSIFDAIELTFRDGKLYYTPVVIEKFHIFDPVFEIPKPWTAEGVINFKENLYYTNLEKYSSHPTCGDCCFIGNCSRGDHHAVMTYLSHDQCLTDMKNRHDLNLKNLDGHA